ncbi:methyl-accepting chemotaxis protein [bacterium]|nr:methyl-accepting chemotaxis protein [bacterium]
MLNKLKFKQKMLIIANMVLVFFIIILSLTWLNNRGNQRRNDLVSDGFCPAYMLNRDLSEYLTSIHMKLQQAVSTLETDALKEADSARDVFLALLEKGHENPVVDPEDLDQYKADLIAYYNHARALTEKMIQGDMGGDIVNESKIMNERYDALKNLISLNGIRFEEEMKSNFSHIRTRNRRSMLIMVGILLISMGLIGGFTYSIVYTVTANLHQMVDMMKNIAKGEGDLTQRLNVQSYDELGDLANWFNLFVEKLHAIMNQVRENTIRVSSAVSIISSTAVQMAAGAEEHNAQAGEVSASVEEMTASIMQNSQNAGQTAKIAEESSNQVNLGVETMITTRNDMERIVSSATQMESIVKSLTNRALQIGEITRVIDKIADQTNLLALNAAVEAARAGEQGSGFAVVADEVRKLAERTAEATREIAETIDAIQKDTIEASESMMETKDAVNSGQKSTKQTGDVLAKLLESVNLSVDMIQQIAAASEEQSAGAEEISANVESMNTVSKQTSEGAEQMSAAAQELNSQTEGLRNLVNQFKLNIK